MYSFPRLNDSGRHFIAFYVCLFLISVGTPVPTASAVADEKSVALEKYLTEDVIAVAYFDLEKIDPMAVLKTVHQLGAIDESEFNQCVSWAATANSHLGKLRASGVRTIFVLIRVSDIANAGPTIVMPLVTGSNSDQSAAAAKQVLAIIPEPFRSLKIQAAEDAVFVTTSETQMKRMLAVNEQVDGNGKPRDLSAAWQAIGSGSAGLLVMGDVDSRRVIRGLFPKLPPPFERLSGPLVADHLNWAGVQLNLPPDLKVKMEIQTDNEQASDVFNEAIQNGLNVLEEVPEFQSLLPETERALVLKTLQPVKSGLRISVSLNAVTGDVDRVSKILVPHILQVRESARQAEEMNNLRQLALAMHNHESAFQRFPRADGKSEKHPAGLSWRVHILPFVEQIELYKQFKLDEPWDSEHNLPLIQHMPEIYRSPMNINREANQLGRTVYQVPICPEAIFQPDADTAGFRDIKDGSSNTIFIVTVAPDQAAIWTQPDDWEVDLDNSLTGIAHEKRDAFVFAFCDGSVRRIPLTIKPEAMRALITRSGGEVIVDFNE